MSECQLGELCEILDSKRVPLSAMQRAKRQGPYPYYGAQSIIDFVDDYLLDGEYLLVAEDGANLVTRTQDIANLVCGKIWVNNHAHILGYNGKCPLNLLGYILNHSNINPYVTGCAQPKLNQENLRRIKIKLPEKVDEVSSYLSYLDDKIAINRRICENLEAQAQALFKHWFIDFAPFKDGKFVESELGKIPEGWRVGTLEEFVDIKYGKDHKKLNEGNIPAYGSAGLMRTVDNNLYDGESILIPRKGTLNNIMYVNEAFWTVDTMFYTIPKKSNILKYVYWRLKRIDFNKMNVGTSIPSNSTSQLNKLEIVVPTDEILSHFDGIMSCLLQEIMHSQKESKGLVSLRDTLLPKLMSGQIKV